MKRIREIWKVALLFFTGGLCYFCVELAWRGWSHPTMILVGGLCFLGVGGINEVFPRELPMELQALLGAVLITLIEFLSGCVINLWLGLGVWDYSGLPGNVLGQVCLLYTALWYLLAFPTIWLEDFVRWQLLGAERPWYCWKRGTFGTAS